MSITYLIGLLLGFIIIALGTPNFQLVVFFGLLILVGLLWGHWIAENKDSSQFGKLIANLTAGILMAVPLHFILSHIFVGVIFFPFR